MAEMDDNAKGDLTQCLGTFNRDSLRAQRFQMLTTSLFGFEIKYEVFVKVEKAKL